MTLKWWFISTTHPFKVVNEFQLSPIGRKHDNVVGPQLQCNDVNSQNPNVLQFDKRWIDEICGDVLKKIICM